MNDKIPSPSHPINREIKWGIKIRRFIDRTNNRTNILNRGLNGSSDMYVLAKIITFPAINITVADVRSPT